MTQSITRRFVGNVVKLVGRSWPDVTQELEEFLEKFLQSHTGGIPSGFNSVTPEILSPNDASAIGDEEDGWASASHRHALDLLLGAKGDILTHTGTEYAVLSQSSAPDGASLVKDSTAPSGFSYSTQADDAELLAWII